MRTVLGASLVESDPRISALSRRWRVKSFVFSIGLQAALLATAVLVPLLATGERPRVVFLTPVPPYRGAGAASAPAPDGPRSESDRKPQRTPVWSYHPPRIPPGVVQDSGKAESLASATQGNGSQLPGMPEGLLPSVPGFDPGRWIGKPPEAPAPPRSAKPLRVSPGVQLARLVKRVMPVYPELAKRARVEGVVELRAIIARDGTVREIRVLSGHILFVRAAVEAVERWRFQPTMLGDEPVEVETQITVVFSLRQ